MKQSTIIVILIPSSCMVVLNHTMHVVKGGQHSACIGCPNASWDVITDNLYIIINVNRYGHAHRLCKRQLVCTCITNSSSCRKLFEACDLYWHLQIRKQFADLVRVADTTQFADRFAGWIAESAQPADRFAESAQPADQFAHQFITHITLYFWHCYHSISQHQCYSNRWLSKHQCQARWVSSQHQCYFNRGLSMQAPVPSQLRIVPAPVLF